MKRTNLASGDGNVFGIEGYRIPDTSLHFYRPRTTKMSKYNIPHFIDKITKEKEFVPPAKYDTIIDWKNCLGIRGKFTKSPRMTFTEKIMHDEKLKPEPGPGAYDSNSQ